MRLFSWPVPLFAFLVLAFPAGPANAQETFRVGQIFIVGNFDVPQYVIRPGDKISLADMRRAQARLRSVGLWDMLTVSLVGAGSRETYRDVLVNTQEKRWNWLFLGVGYELVAFRFTGQVEHLYYGLNRFNEKVQEWVAAP